jgi:outer membrane receptor protein involved in Fe transport
MGVRLVALVAGLLVCGMLAAAPYQAGDVVVAVFERGVPAEGLTVTIRGVASENTDDSGIAELSPGAGRHQIEVLRGSTSQAAVNFELSAGDAAEISINLAGLGREARSSVEVFSPGSDDGVISGVVRGPQGAPVSGAEVSVDDSGAVQTTGQDGRFSFELPRGSYALRVSHPTLQTGRFTGVRALGSVEGDVDLAIRRAPAEGTGPIEEMIVIGSYVPTTSIGLERDSESVLDVITEEEISLAGDSTAVEALRRVTGVTVQEDIVIVRGLGERYSTTLFNGAELPSPDPTRRAVGLDIFPSDLTSGITVQKTYTANLPADFSGGAVLLQTRSIPDSFTGRLSVSTGANSRSTFQDGFTHNGGETDFLGIDDGDRDIPGLAKLLTNNGARPLSQLTTAENEQVAEALVAEFPWNLRGFDMPADLDVDFSVGNRFQFDEVDVGVNLAGLYGSKWRYTDELRAEILANAQGGEFVGESARLERSENSISAGAVLNLVADIGLDHTLSYTSFLSRDSLKGTFLEQGFNRSDDRDYRQVVLEFSESQLFSNQLSGVHVFNDFASLGVDWQVTYSTAERDEPGTREYTYSRAEGSDDPFRLATGPGEAGLPPLLTWEYLDEDSVDASVDFTLPASFRGGEVTGEFKFGGRITEREREFDTVRWRFALAPGAGSGDLLFFPSLAFPSVEMILTPQRLGPNGFRLVNATSALAGGGNADNYDGELDIQAGYVLGDFDIGSRFRVQGGVRIESADLSVTTEAIAGGAPRTGELSETDYLPSLNLTWFVNEASQVRFAASRTLNRPQFRELSTAPYRDPKTRFELVGNPNLQQSEVTNLDLRYERYWSRNEGFTAAVFYKDIDSPIEVVTIGGGSDERGVRTFANADSAELYGVELDGRLSFAAFENVAGFLANTYVTGNVAWIESDVTIAASDLGVTTNASRELQGQSPWVANLGLGYSNPVRGTDALLLFNMFGERITEAGVNLTPDAKEQPRALLDFNLKQVLFNDWVLGLKLRNILDSKFEVKQGSEIQRSFKTGREISLSLAFEF